MYDIWKNVIGPLSSLNEINGRGVLCFNGQFYLIVFTGSELAYCLKVRER